MNNLSKFKLTTISPVYIGCDENLSPYSDYIYKDGKVYFIDEKKLIGFFKTRDDMDKVMDDYIGTIQVQASSNLKNRHNLEDFFDKYGLEIEDFIAYSLEANGNITQSINRTINSSGRPYIPGSTLKGSMRTCILYYHIKRDNIEPSGRSPYIGQDVFGSFAQDLLKHFSVSDTSTVSNQDCQILRTGRYNLKKKSLDVPMVVEAIKPSTEFQFTINLKGKGPKFPYLKQGNIGEVLKIINQFYLENIEREIKVLEENKNPQIHTIMNFYQELYKEILSLRKKSTGALLRIGGGKTFYENSILLGLDKGSRDRIITAGNSRRKIKRDKDFFPKTRMVTVDNGQYNQVLGWVKIELE